MNIKLISGKTVNITEEQIQKTFEGKLDVLEEELEYVDSEVQIGTGRIDTLAINGETRETPGEALA